MTDDEFASTVQSMIADERFRPSALSVAGLSAPISLTVKAFRLPRNGYVYGAASALLLMGWFL